MVLEQQDPAPPDDGLTDQQRAFADEYCAHFNATKAALAADYSPNNAYSQGSRLLKHAKVRAYIDARLTEAADAAGISKARVLAELATLGLSDISHYAIDPYGEVSLKDDAPPGAWRAVQSVKRVCKADEDGNTTVTTELKLWDKNNALQMLGRHHAMFTDKSEHEIGPALADLLGAAKTKEGR